MEFLRFGSSIPGSYWGCCACCIIQNFKVDPDDKASIQIVSGDGGGPIGDQFAGPTWRDIFWQRLRVGTFSNSDMPNHAFLAILTSQQVSGGVGAKWLAILKEAGFEFIRTVDNSVYTGPNLGKPVKGGSHPNYIFGLFRNIGRGAVADPFTPPKAWTDLSSVKPEAWQALFRDEADVYLPDAVNAKGEPIEGGGIVAMGQDEFLKRQRVADLAIWNKIGKAKFLTEAQIVAAGAPVILAGLRSENKQEAKATREARRGTSGQKSMTAPAAAPISVAGLAETPAACPATPV
jgi:hypothetical protein